MPRPPDRTVRILGLTGMHNLRETKGYLLNEAGMAAPHTVLNADVTEDGTVRPRGGFTLLTPLPGAHSIWSGTTALCVAADTLYRLEGAAAIPIGKVTAMPSSRMSYAERGGTVYMCNGFWRGAYDVGAARLRSWGLDVPTPPTVATVPGDLPPGSYKLCYTRYVDGRFSGNSDLVEVSWEGGTGGIRFVDKPADCLAWITQPNGSELFLAPIDGSGTVVSPHYNRPLPTFGVIPPPAFTFAAWGHGRMWGVHGSELWYSDEFRPEYFRPYQKFPFEQPLVNVAVFDGGLYVNSLKTTWSLVGRDPSKTVRHVLGDGAIPGDVVHALVEGAGYEVSRQLTRVRSPVWASRTGVVVGTSTGHLVHITQTRLRMNPRSMVSALCRMKNGRQQVLLTMRGPLTADPDQTALGDFARGRLFIPAPASQAVRGGLVISGGIT